MVGASGAQWAIELGAERSIEQVEQVLDWTRAFSVGPHRNQKRLVVPDPTRIRSCTPGGDVLVALARGSAGKKKKHRRIARSLGLRRFGDQAVLRRDDRSRLGMAFRIGHLVAITFMDRPLPRDFMADQASGTDLAKVLYPPPGDTRFARWWKQLAAEDWVGLVRAVDLIPDTGVDGGYFEFKNEEYFQIEVSDEGASVQWSSQAAADVFVGRLVDLVGAPPHLNASYLVYTDGEIEDDVDTAEAVEAARHRADDLRLFTLCYEDNAVSWRRAAIKVRDGHIPHVQLAMSAEELDYDVLIELIDATATSEVRNNLDVFRRRLMQFVKRVEHS